jgi:large subunit ribosomal protein L14e
MTLFDVGRVCLKLAGRDAGKQCVVVSVLDNTYVLVDGSTRRKKVNILHLEPLAGTLEIKDNASHEDVKVAFAKYGVTVVDTKPRNTANRVKKHKKKKQAKPVKKGKSEKKSVKATESSAKTESKTENKPESKPEPKIESKLTKVSESKESKNPEAKP